MAAEVGDTRALRGLRYVANDRRQPRQRYAPPVITAIGGTGSASELSSALSPGDIGRRFDRRYRHHPDDGDLARSSRRPASGSATKSACIALTESFYKVHPMKIRLMLRRVAVVAFTMRRPWPLKRTGSASRHVLSMRAHRIMTVVRRPLALTDRNGRRTSRQLICEPTFNVEPTGEAGCLQQRPRLTLPQSHPRSRPLNSPQPSPLRL